MEIFNMKGDLLVKENIYNKTLFECDLSKFSDGLYLIKIYTKSNIYSKKIIKQ